VEEQQRLEVAGLLAAREAEREAQLKAQVGRVEFFLWIGGQNGQGKVVGEGGVSDWLCSHINTCMSTSQPANHNETGAVAAG